MKTTYKVVLLIVAIIVGFMYYGCESNPCDPVEETKDNISILAEKYNIEIVYEENIFNYDCSIIHFESHTGRLHLFNSKGIILKSLNFNNITSFKLQ